MGVDKLGPVVREYLKTIVRNVTQRAWWVRVRLCTNSDAIYSRSCFDAVVCLYYWVTLVLSVCTVKVKPSQYSPEVPRGFQEIKVAQGGGKVVSLTHRPLFTPKKYSWYSFLLEAEPNPGA